MDRKELNFILQEGEGFKIEFKENIRGIDKGMVALANASGGRIFLGVNDESKVKGIRVTNKLKSDVQSTAHNCDPPIDIRLKQFSNVLIIEVKEGKDKPYKCKEGFFMRVGPNSQKMSRDKILGLAADRGKVRFDEQINREFNFKRDFDKKKFDEFLERSRISEAGSVENGLFNLSLGKRVKNRFKLNNAGVLFFGRYIERFFRQNFVTCVLYKGKERINMMAGRILKTIC